MTDPGPGPEEDGSTPVEGLTEAELYVLIRKATEDAILGVIGTVLLVGIGFVLAYAGLSAALFGGLDGDPAVAVGALALGVFGLYVAAATLGVVPSVREWW